MFFAEAKEGVELRKTVNGFFAIGPQGERLLPRSL